jgi:putative peptide zinc metalloprotease protein
VCVVLGGAALIMQASGAITALTSPLPMVDVLIVAVVLVAATFAHEAAHGVMLTSAGARPRRAGVMLLYLGPAFFVDVTDAWRLPSRRLRVAVALAGPAVHAVMGGAAALAALFTTDPDVRRTLLVLSCACAAVVLVNLVPFVRFDGYIALMSAVDEPNLRARTMADAGATVRWLLFGTEPPPRALARWWSVPFGLLSVAVPTTLVWFALERAVRALSGTGALGAFLALALQVVVLVAVGVPVARWLAASVRQGRRRLRGLVMGATLLAAIITAAAVVPVADARAAGFLLVDGRPVLVVPADGSAAVPVTAGTPVELMTSGILGDARVAVGTVRPQTSWTLSVPISAFTPLAATGVRVEATAVGVVDVAAGDALPSAGRAFVQLGTRSLLSQVWCSHVTGPLSTLLTAFPSSLSGSQEGQS